MSNTRRSPGANSLQGSIYPSSKHDLGSLEAWSHAATLGISSDNARRRLARAQRAAIDIAAGEDVDMPEEDSND